LAVDSDQYPVTSNMNLAAYNDIRNFIGGVFQTPRSGNYIDNINPATAELIGKIPDSNEKDIAEAVNAAKKALPGWSLTPVEKRFQILNRVADLIDENRDALALAETTDNGKPLSLSKKLDIPRASANFRFFATGIMHFATESHHMEDKAVNYSLRQPLGIVGCISPWNLPLYLFTWKISPALAAGNTVVWKPSEKTPLCSLAAQALTQRAIKEFGKEAPAGLSQLLLGAREPGQALIADPRVPLVSATGSFAMGHQVAPVLSKRFARGILELGGNNASIVTESADLELALR